MRLIVKAGLLAFTAGWLARPRPPTARVLRVSRVVADLDRAEAFYTEALGFRRVASSPANPPLATLLGLPGARLAERVLQLGQAEIALVRIDPPGALYPAGSHSDDLSFQHLAIVTSDMDAAYTRLMQHAPQPISTAGPERLPARNGGVTAFKFRDPDGHPLELIQFPGRPAAPGPTVGIDHTALSVRATPRSIAFYRALGFKPTARSLNWGPAQSRMDGLPDAHVRVTALRPLDTAGIGLELLGYDPPGRPAPMGAASDIATDWVTILTTALPRGATRLLHDPDGHRMLLIGRSPR